MKKLLTICFVISLSGCAGLTIDGAIANHQAIAASIKLGDRIEIVLPKLNRAMQKLRGNLKKFPDQYIKKGVKVEIHYARSGWQNDGLTTDDEFTPYVFNNGVLVAIGWQTLGGAKSTGKVVPRTNIYVPPPIIVY